MKKIILFSFLVSISFGSNIFSSTQLELEKRTILTDKLNRMSLKDPQTKEKIKEELKKHLAINYSNISDHQDKISISELLKKIGDLNFDNSTNNTEKLTIKNTILSTIKRATSPAVIVCVTCIVLMLQIKGILTSEELIGVLKEISSIMKWHTWGNAAGIIANFIRGIFFAKLS